jgi:hypothetical protein
MRVSMRSTFRIGSCQSTKDGAREDLNKCVDILAVVQFQSERNFVFQLVLEVGSVRSLDTRSIR